MTTVSQSAEYYARQSHSLQHTDVSFEVLGTFLKIIL